MSRLKLIFHHIGVAVPDIQKALPIYQSLFGYEVLSGPFDDPLQNVTVCFLGLPNSRNSFEIELVAPLTDGSPIKNVLAKGGGTYHLCYSVLDLTDALAEVKAKGCLVLSEPVPAVAFGMRRIAWFLTPTRQLIELVEAESDAKKIAQK